jgi:type II secretory pathway component PulL
MSVVRAKTKADIIHGSDTSRAIDPGENQLQALDSSTSIPNSDVVVVLLPGNMVVFRGFQASNPN